MVARDGDAFLGSLSLGEAAEKAGNESKVVTSGAPSGKAGFRRRGPTMAASLSTQPNCSASSRRKGPSNLPWNRTEGPRPRLRDNLKRAQHPETAETNNVAVAFAVLGAELQDLLGLPVEKRSSTESHQHDAERQAADLTERNAQLAAELAAMRATGKPVKGDSRICLAGGTAGGDCRGTAAMVGGVSWAKRRVERCRRQRPDVC